MKIKKILYKSFDSVLLEKEERLLKEKLLFSEKLRQKRDKIEKLRIELAIMKTAKFSSSFENNLLKKIQTPNYPKIFLYKELNFTFNRLVIVAILIIAFLIAFNFSEFGKVSILKKQNIKFEEAVNSEYLYLSDIETGKTGVVTGDKYGL